MMKLDQYYIHATGGYKGINNDKNNIIKILHDGKIKADGIEKNCEDSPKNCICLCDVTRPVIQGSAGYSLASSYKDFVLYSPSLLFSRDLEVQIPKYDNYHPHNWDPNTADMYDEVQYFGELSLDKLQLITFPVKYSKELYPSHDSGLYFFISDLMLYRDNIQSIEKDYNTIPIKDIYTGQIIHSSDIDQEIEDCKKRMIMPYKEFKKYYDR